MVSDTKDIRNELYPNFIDFGYEVVDDVLDINCISYPCKQFQNLEQEDIIYKVVYDTFISATNCN